LTGKGRTQRLGDHLPAGVADLILSHIDRLQDGVSRQGSAKLRQRHSLLALTLAGIKV
jgi:hypothetical protein